MIDATQNLILIKDEIKTRTLESCVHDPKTDLFTVVYKNSNKLYRYGYVNVIWLRNPRHLNPQDYQVKHKGKTLQNVELFLEFSNRIRKYYFIQFIGGRQADFVDEELEINESCLSGLGSKEVFSYFKNIAQINNLQTEEGVNLLAAQYESIAFLNNTLAIAPYIAPNRYDFRQWKGRKVLFPFGCNKSQMQAVQRAFDNQISVIQGPPGTGKTQTILNIIANILLRGQTVLVVSNNNSALENVLEKMTKSNLDFLVAFLGCSENKKKFEENLSHGRKYPDEMSKWKNTKFDEKNVSILYQAVTSAMEKQESKSALQQLLSSIEIEWLHFKKEQDIQEDYHLEKEIDYRILHLNSFFTVTLAMSSLSKSLSPK